MFSTLHTNAAPQRGVFFCDHALVDWGAALTCFGAFFDRVGVLAQRLVEPCAELRATRPRRRRRRAIDEVIKQWRLNGGVKPTAGSGCSNAG